jgi:hypothetical protein
MIGTSTAIRGFVVSLVSGILAVTLIPLGIVFALLEPPLGLIFLGAGVLCALAALLTLRAGRARSAREEAARVTRGSAQVVEAKHNYHSQIGVRHPVELTVELAGGHRTRKLYVPSHIDWKPGERIEVAFAPEDPGNFVPVDG